MGRAECAPAAQGGHLESAEVGAGARLPVGRGECALAAMGGHLEVLAWAPEHDCPWNSRTITWAANEEVRQWAIEHCCPGAL